MKKTALRLMSALVIMFVAAGLIGCGTAQKQAPQPTPQQTPQSNEQKTLKPLKIGVLPIEDNLPFYIAEKDGLFAKEGLTVQLVPFSSAQERDIALQAGQIDGQVADLVALALLNKGGTPAKAAALGLGVTPKEGRFALLTAPKSEAKTIADLKGKQIGISENSIIEFVLDQMLADAGLSPADVKKVPIPKMPSRMEMLLNNNIDAAVLPDPLAFLVEKQGAGLIADDTKKNVSQTVILFRQASISDNFEAIRLLVKIYGEAGQALTKEPDKYKALVVEKANIPGPIQNTYPIPSFSKPVSPTKDDVSRVLNWMVSKKLLEKTYSYEELVDTKLIP